MTASELAGAVSFGVMVVAGVGSGFVEDPIAKKLLYAVGLAAIVWYVWKGHALKGWIGDSYAEMAKEIQRLESLSAQWLYPDGREVPFEKRREILRRHQRLIEKIQFHPDHPKNNR